VETPLLIRGSCHCGNIAFRLDWSPDPVEIPARACDCTFCMKHGGVWTSNPQGTLEVAVREPAKVTKYAFGTKTADFHICGNCGAVPVVTSEIDGRTYAVVSVNAFDNVDRAMLRPKSASFDREDVDARLDRRKTRWIPDVRFVEADPG
jgi:hypothetical protein